MNNLKYVLVIWFFHIFMRIHLSLQIVEIDNMIYSLIHLFSIYSFLDYLHQTSFLAVLRRARTHAEIHSKVLTYILGVWDFRLVLWCSGSQIKEVLKSDPIEIRLPGLDLSLIWIFQYNDESRNSNQMKENNILDK